MGVPINAVCIQCGQYKLSYRIRDFGWMCTDCIALSTPLPENDEQPCLNAEELLQWQLQTLPSVRLQHAERCVECHYRLDQEHKNVGRIPVLQDEELVIGNELVIAKPISRRPLTMERLNRTYDPAEPVSAPLQRVYAVGSAPPSAIAALGVRIGWGAIDNITLQEQTERTGDCWYATFTADGTSMKAGGRTVPGGVVLDWWK